MLTMLSTFRQQHPLVVVLSLAGIVLGACPFTGVTSLGSYNAYWNNPTPSPVPTVCIPVTPTPGCDLCTPGPPVEQCTDPLPTATPYGRWLSPGDRGTSSTFYRHQDVRIGPLRMTLQSYDHSTLIPGADGEVAHVWVFDTQNEGSQPLTVTWPLQLFVREITGADGTTTTGAWWETSRAERAVGLPAWNPATAGYAPGEHRVVTVAIQGPAGAAHAVGFLPDPVGGSEARPEVGPAAHVLWFLPADDSHQTGNASGPAQPGDGGATYSRQLPSPPTSSYGYFAGWPVLSNGSSVISQGFGCTAFHEISGYDCPNDRPWFHSGIDIADPSRPLLYSVVHGRVTYVGVSPGRVCTFPGAEDPKTNLGWMIQIQAVDDNGHVGPYTVKYGHTRPGSQRVQVGDVVVPGQVLAQMASTGCSTGPHVHVMVQNEAGTFLDPLNFIGENRR